MIQIDLDNIVPIEDLPNKLSSVVDDAHAGAIYVITKDDRPAVAIVSIDQLEGLSGRKVVTPAEEAIPVAEETKPAVPASDLPETPAPAPSESTAPTDTPAANPQLPTAPPPTPGPTSQDTKQTNDPAKPIDEMPL